MAVSYSTFILARRMMFPQRSLSDRVKAANSCDPIMLGQPPMDTSEQHLSSLHWADYSVANDQRGKHADLRRHRLANRAQGAASRSRFPAPARRRSRPTEAQGAQE